MALDVRLDLAPAEAVAWFESKGNTISWDYTDVWREANAHGFTVAKATSLDVLATIRKEVSRAIGDGQTFEEFRRALRPRLQDLGWWGQQEVTDADSGEVSKVQLGSVRRLRTIYQTNVQTSYMGGRYRRYLDNVQDRPYWRYVAVMDGRTRPLHAKLNGLVWRWDDPIWQVIWPPNGWGCRCRVVALTEAEFQALGVQLQDGSDAIVDLEVPIGRDGRTVAVQGVRFVDDLGKKQVFRPDPGWDYNPGAAWARFEQAESASTEPAAGQTGWQALGRPELTRPGLPRLPDPGRLPAGTNAQATARQLLMTGERWREVETPFEPVVLRPELLPDAASADLQLAPYVLPALRSPFEVWLTAYRDASLRISYLAVFDSLVLLVREARDGSLTWEALAPFDAALDQVRLGTLLYGQQDGSR